MKTIVPWRYTSFLTCSVCCCCPGENFGKYLKVGVVEDEDVKDELAGLCRFFSKNQGEDFVSFDEYIADMKVWFNLHDVPVGAGSHSRRDEVSRGI